MLGRRSRAKRDLAALAVPGAVVLVAERAGQLAERAREGAGELVQAAGPLAERAREGAEDLVERAGPLAERAREGAEELVERAGPVVETVSGVLEEAVERGGAAWTALRGDRVPAPAAGRRWPWAVAAAVAGAAAAAGVTAVLRKVAPADAPGAQEPHELRAVVDLSEAPVVVTPDTAQDGLTVAPPRREADRETGAPTPAPPVAKPTFEM